MPPADQSHLRDSASVRDGISSSAGHPLSSSMKSSTQRGSSYLKNTPLQTDRTGAAWIERECFAEFGRQYELCGQRFWITEVDRKGMERQAG
jgi:hypothetical protein